MREETEWGIVYRPAAPLTRSVQPARLADWVVAVARGVALSSGLCVGYLVTLYLVLR